MKNNIFIIYAIFIIITFFACSANLEAKQVNSDEAKGVVYFSNGADLIKYDFSSKKEEKLFRYREDSELGKRITNVTYSAYLKNNSKILFIGSSASSELRLFEADLDLKNWKEYTNTKDVGNFSISPDEKIIAYYRYPNKIAIKKYGDLEKEGCEKIVATAAFARPLWISNSELVYYSMTNSIVRVDINSGVQLTLANNFFPESISPDKKYMLCSSKDSISLCDISTFQLKLLVKNQYLYGSSPNIWSPDGKYFLYSKFQKVKLSLNIVKYMNDLTAEKRDIYVYCLTTGKEEKMLKDEDACFGGFWLNDNSNENIL
jgi:Tol biopolymer transport system component